MLFDDKSITVIVLAFIELEPMLFDDKSMDTIVFALILLAPIVLADKSSTVKVFANRLIEFMLFAYTLAQFKSEEPRSYV